MTAAATGWEMMVKRTRVVKLSPLIQVLIPPLLASTFSKSARGVSFQGGKPGLLLGVVVICASLGIGWLLTATLGILGYVALFWLVGTTGVVMAANSKWPVAFVKPICTRCRLLPIIVEHEAIHLSGVAREDAVWTSMRQRYSVDSLKLKGDPAICDFCPIPRRLGER